MTSSFHELTPPALMMLAPISGSLDNMSFGAPSPEVQIRRDQGIRETLFTPSSLREALIAAYPELQPVCEHLGNGLGMGLAPGRAIPEGTLLILARSARPPPPSPICDWSQAELIELVDDLIGHHHRPMRNELQRIAILMRSIVHRHAEPGISHLEKSFTRLMHHLLAHLDLEESAVFPQCLAIERALSNVVDDERGGIDVTTGIRAMAIGHDDDSVEISNVLEISAGCMRELADADLGLIHEGLLAMKADYITQTAKEDEILVPAAIFAEDRLRARVGPRPLPHDSGQVAAGNSNVT